MTSTQPEPQTQSEPKPNPMPCPKPKPNPSGTTRHRSSPPTSAASSSPASWEQVSPTIGRLLAAGLNWSFLGLDAHLESRTGATIPQLFERRGPQLASSYGRSDK
jgi:shikimate kinase